MNIVVKTVSEHILVRPDTTWKRNNDQGAEEEICGVQEAVQAERLKR